VPLAVWVSLLAAATLAVDGDPPAPPPQSDGRDSAAIAAGDGQRAFDIGRRNLFRGSDSLSLNGCTLVRDRDYAIDYRLGRLFFALPLAPADTAVIWFRALSVSLPESLVHVPQLPAAALLPPDSRQPAAPDAALGGPAADPEAPTAVRFGGSKTFSIATGSNRDLALEQSLNVSANGRLSPGLEISAQVSDRNLPLTAAGTTGEVSQLEQMFIQARAEHWRAAVGDLELTHRALSLLQFDRQLEGVHADGWYGSATASAAYSAAKGKGATIRFAGQEGTQGPYRLSPGDGAGEARLLPNSQKVWLDGELLVPGAAADYVIDHDRAELTFTPRRPITGDSRIVAQFQYSALSYRRSLTFIAGSLRPTDWAAVHAAYLEEADDADRPAGDALTDSQRAALARAGNDTAAMWVDGGTPVEPGTGWYARADSFYVYDPSGAGDYSVTFTAVGSGGGDYVYDSSLGGFRYVGARAGDYAARRRLSGPQTERTAGLRTEFAWDGGAAHFEGSTASFDRNTLSAIGDDDNQGRAGTASLRWKRDSLPWGGFELRSDWTSVGAGYRNGSVERRPGFEAEWGLANWGGMAPVEPAGPRQEMEWGAAYTLLQCATVGGGWGRLAMPGGLWNRKYQAASSIGLAKWPRLEYRYLQHRVGGAWPNRPDQTGRRDRHQAQSAWRRGPWGIDAGLVSSIDLLQRDTAWSEGARFWEASLGWARNGGGLALEQSVKRRDDRRRDSAATAWSGQSFATTVTSRAGWHRADRFNITADHTYRQVRLRPGAAGQGLNSHLAALHADHARPDGQLRLSLDYTLGSTAAALKQELYLRVPDRTGDHSYDPGSGRFYPDTAGNYRRTVTDQGAAVLATENAAKAYLSLTPVRSRGWWKGSRLDLLSAASISSPEAMAASTVLFQRGRLWRPTNLRSHLDLSGEASHSSVSGWNVRTRLRWRREADSRFVTRRTETQLVERRGEVFLPLAASGRLTLSAEYAATGTSAVGTGMESGETAVTIGGDGGWHPVRDLELALRAGYARERLEHGPGMPPPIVVRYGKASAAPYLTLQLGPAGSVRTEFGLIHWAPDRPPGEIPVEFAFTRPPGLTKTWSLQYDYRVNANLTSSAGYDGRKRPDLRPEHNARLDLRAYF